MRHGGVERSGPEALGLISNTKEFKKEMMKDIIYYYKMMLAAKKYAKISEISFNEYMWYKYLLNYKIKEIFERFGQHKCSNEELPF